MANRITTIFVDDGGVLNDNRLRPAQWQRLVGEYFAPRLGGTPERWGEANRDIFRKLWSGDEGDVAPGKFETYREWHYAYATAWLGHMCEHVGVPIPAPDRAHRFVVDADDYIIRRVKSDVPGAPEAVRALKEAGYLLHMGSGGDSRQLANYLEVLGIRECFHTLYGADLVNVTKDRPEFHRRVLADAGVDPAEALFIDDTAAVLEWAAGTGANTALIAETPVAGVTFNAPSLANLASQLLNR